jgi:hypothetical protein
VVLGTQTDGQTSFTADLRQAGTQGARFEVDVKLREAAPPPSDLAVAPVRRATVALAAVASGGLLEAVNSATPRVTAGRPVEVAAAPEVQIRTPIGEKPDEQPITGDDPLDWLRRMLLSVASTLRSMTVKGFLGVAPRKAAARQVERNERADRLEGEHAPSGETARAEAVWNQTPIEAEAAELPVAESPREVEERTGQEAARSRRIGRASWVIGAMLATAWVGLQGGAGRRVAWPKRQIEEEVDDE